MYGPMLDKVSFLRNFRDDDLVVELGLLLKPHAALAGTAIAQQGDEADAMYVNHCTTTHTIVAR